MARGDGRRGAEAAPVLAPAVAAELRRRGVAHRMVARGWGVSVEGLVRAGRIPAGRAARAVLLGSRQGPVIALLPWDHLVDFRVLEAELGGAVAPLPPRAVRHLFPDCDAGCIPPVGRPYGLPTVVEPALLERREVVLEGGRRHALFAIRGRDLWRLAAKGRALRFTCAPERLALVVAAEVETAAGGGAALRALCPRRDPGALEGLPERLPAPDAFAARLLELPAVRADRAAALADVVGADPVLAVQLVRWARLPLRPAAGPVRSLREAVGRVLGFGLAFELARAMRILRVFRGPRLGGLGREAVVRGAVYTAALCEALAPLVPPKARPARGAAVAAGLLHKAGVLAWGELLRPEYLLMERVLELRPDLALPVVERRVLSATLGAGWTRLAHAPLGAALAERWGLSPEATRAVREHHNELCRGADAGAANLVLAAAHALRQAGIGHATPSRDPPREVLAALGLGWPQVLAQTRRVLAAAAALDRIARALAA
ncbi:aminoacyl-tRNA editing protein [Inmirania thermothiophila]|uniref:Aminoacyl-tRNA editing protein n=1 Tax=Inmirania thermothiophila TaxID=1750597 RepID=A0A3N1Y6K1_9GAMM|nr:aminoacyl-tRNA editing protein [Inmirania thermothiophila]